MRDDGQSQLGSAEGSAAVGKSPVGAAPTAVGQSAGAGLTAVREMICVTDVRGISEQWDADKLQCQLTLVRRGISQISQGGLERKVRTSATWRQGTKHLATA